MSNSIIRAAFETRIAAWAAALSPPLPVAWQNRIFIKPAPGLPYAESFLLPARTQSIDLARANREYLGVYQLSLHMPAGPGSTDGEALVQALDALLPCATPLLQAGLHIYITEPMSAAPALRDDDGRYHIPVSCRYHCDV